MWTKDNQYVCDICGQPGPMYVRVANLIVAEVCAEHAEEIKADIRAKLKTQPGPPPDEKKETP